MSVETTIEHVPGFQVAGVHCGLKKNGALDFALIYSETPCTVAGIFTTNQVKAAPVLVDMEKLKNNPTGIRALAINTGSANACTGAKGIENAHATARYVAEKLNINEDSVLVLSTGVIGMHLPMEKIRHGVDLAVEKLGNDWRSAASAIMTTDTHPKLASAQVGAAHVAGISKGSGMIAPNMATMLGVLATDAVLPDAKSAYTMLKSAADLSYNRIVVDGDTSTNDTVLLLANGKSGPADVELLQPALTDIGQFLAKSIVRDGEGASKMITVHVTGLHTDAEAYQVANTIATSPLVKTAFYGSDANWGRILAAAGRAGVAFDDMQMSLKFAAGSISPEEIFGDTGLTLVISGTPTEYQEADAAAIMAEEYITVMVDCGIANGRGKATVWTCDLSHDYVSINADYRT